MPILGHLTYTVSFFKKMGFASRLGLEKLNVEKKAGKNRFAHIIES